MMQDESNILYEKSRKLMKNNIKIPLTGLRLAECSAMGLDFLAWP